VILYQDDDDPDAFLDRGDQLLSHHQEGAVTNHHEDVSVGASHTGADAPGDLVAHA
jgi:hypothetical protein